jgi:F1F0 ATPase subunit 2
MTEPISLILVLVAGFGLGILFYGGLWMTVRALPASRHPTVLALGSFWGRTALVLAGFLFIAARRWQNAVVCLVGFILARIVLGHWIPQHGANGRGLA